MAIDGNRTDYPTSASYRREKNPPLLCFWNCHWFHVLLKWNVSCSRPSIKVISQYSFVPVEKLVSFYIQIWQPNPSYDCCAEVIKIIGRQAALNIPGYWRRNEWGSNDWMWLSSKCLLHIYECIFCLQVHMFITANINGKVVETRVRCLK